MKTLEEIKEEYAVELGFDSFEHMFYDEGHEMGEMGIDEIAKRYATACIQADRLRVAESVEIELSDDYLYVDKNYDFQELDKKSIIKSITDLPIELL